MTTYETGVKEKLIENHSQEESLILNGMLTALCKREAPLSEHSYVSAKPILRRR